MNIYLSKIGSPLVIRILNFVSNSYNSNTGTVPEIVKRLVLTTINIRIT